MSSKAGIKRLLLTGSNGLLGQKIVLALRHDPAFVVTATSKGPNRISVEEGYGYMEMDIVNPDQVKKIFDRVKPDTVIHTAAMTNVDACEAKQELCWKINVQAVQHLVDACRKYNTHLIHLSTDFVFDGENGPYREDDPVAPLSHYARSKVASEEIVQQSGLRWTILRTIIIYGVAERMSRSNIVLWVKEALEKGEKLRIVNDQYRMPTLAEDLALACISAARKEATGIYHISGKDMMNMTELARRVADYFGGNKDLIEEISTGSLNQAARRPPRTGFVLDKAIRDLEYQPRSFEEGLALLREQLEAMNP